MLHSNKTELFHSRLTGRKTKSRGKSLFFCVQDSRSLVQCWKGYVDLSLEEGALCWVLLLIIVADADTKVLLIVTSWAFWELSHCHGPVLFFTGMWWETACSAPGYERNEGSRKQRGEVYYQLMEEWEVEPEIPVKQLEYGIALAPLFVRILYAVSDSESSPFLPKNQSSSPASRLVDIRNPSKLQDSCNINI